MRLPTPHLLVPVALLALAACGGSSASESDPARQGASATSAGQSAEAPADSAATAAAVTDPAAQPTPSDTAAPAPAAEAPAAASSSRTAICDTIPPLDVISAAVGEPVTTSRDLSGPSLDPTAENGLEMAMLSDKCEVTGDGVGLATFERWDVLTARGVVEQVTADGYGVEFSDPDLPGAVGFSNGVLIERGDIAYYVSLVTMDAIGDPKLPATYEAAGNLLQAWLPTA